MNNEYEIIRLTKQEYKYLLISQARLEQLEINGVDNWTHYGCMCQENMEDGCIFCTEDEEEFLKLK